MCASESKLWKWVRITHNHKQNYEVENKNHTHIFRKQIGISIESFACNMCRRAGEEKKAGKRKVLSL